MATVFFMAIMAGAGWYVYEKALRGGDYVEVPDVTMRPITQASFLLAEKGLEIGRQKQVADDRIPKYYVIGQRPPAGKVVREGRRVNLTVSAGTESLTPPNLVGKTLQEAKGEIDRTMFALGSVARLARSSPRDMVIAQDPAATRLVSSDARINLLVSDGKSARMFIMPDIMNRPVQEVLQILSPLGVKPKPERVDLPDAPCDVVLNQQPAPGTLIREGDLVVYTVRDSGLFDLPDAERKIQISYTAPHSWFKREVRVDAIDRYGVRVTAYPQEKHYVNGMPPKLGSGETLTGLTISFIDQMTVEIFLDGQLAESRYYEGDADPVITKYKVE